MNTMKKQIPIEVENDEVAQLPNGQLLEFMGATHEQGGIPTVLPEGSTVFSDRIKIDGVSLSDRKKKREKKSITLEILMSKYNDKLLENTMERVQEVNQLEEEHDKDLQTKVNQMMSVINSENDVTEAAYGREIADPNQNWFQPMPGMNDYQKAQVLKQHSIENPLTAEHSKLKNIARGVSEMYNSDEYQKALNLDLAAGALGGLSSQLISNGLSILNGELLKSITPTVKQPPLSTNPIVADSKLNTKSNTVIGPLPKYEFAYGGTLDDEYLFEENEQGQPILNPLIFDALIANDELPKAAYGMDIDESYGYVGKVDKYGGKHKFGDDYINFWKWIEEHQDTRIAQDLLKMINSGKFEKGVGKNTLTYDDIFHPKKTKSDISGNKKPLYIDGLQGAVHNASLAMLNRNIWDPNHTDGYKYEAMEVPNLFTNANIKLGDVPTISTKISLKELKKIAKKNQKKNQKKNELNNGKSKSLGLEKTLAKTGKFLLDNMPKPGDIMYAKHMNDYLGKVGEITNKQFANTKPNINPYLQYGLSALDTIEDSRRFTEAQRDNYQQDLNLTRNAAINRNQNSARSVNTLRALNNSTDDYMNKANRQLNSSFDQQMLQLMNQKAGIQNQRDKMVMQGEQQRDIADRQDLDNYFTNLSQDEATKFEGQQNFAKFLNSMWSNNVAENVIDSMSKYGFGYNPFGNIFKKK